MIFSTNINTDTNAENRTSLTPAANLILVLGLALGLLADLLWWPGDSIGLGFVAWISFFGLSISLVSTKTNIATQREMIAWSLVGFAAAMVLLYRTTPIVIAAMLLVILFSSAMTIMQRDGRSLRDTIVSDYFDSLRRLPGRCLLAASPLWRQVDFSAHISDPRLRSFSRGIFLAAPLVVLFTYLFSSADVVFGRYVLRSLKFFSPMTLKHLLVIIVLGWLATGLLVGVSENHLRTQRKSKRWLTLDTHDTAALLGTVTALFLTFVYSQLGYLFGGLEIINSTTGLTVAEYARSGFFELLGVAGLTLALLIVVAATNCNTNVFRPLAVVLVACVMVILASAGQRMWLYVTQFGLTIDRLTALAVIGWLGFSLLLFVATVLRGQAKDFAVGLAVSGIIAAFTLAIANPARIVAETNIVRASKIEQNADIYYLLSLGSDAIPTLIQNMESLSSVGRCQLAIRTDYQRKSLTTLSDIGKNDWRWWNASHSAAENAILDHEEILAEMFEACIQFRDPSLFRIN